MSSGLESLSREDLLALLALQQRQIEDLKSTVARLAEEVTELRARLGRNSAGAVAGVSSRARSGGAGGVGRCVDGVRGVAGAVRRLSGHRACPGRRVVRGYTDLVRPFVETAVRQGGPAVLTASDVTLFMVCSADRLAPKTVQRLASALRSLLRFWLVDGVMTVSLIEAVPKVAHHPAHPPRGLEPAKVAAMIASCDTTANGQRDLAILLMLSRLGLRAGEVADDGGEPGLALVRIDPAHADSGTAEPGGSPGDLLGGRVAPVPLRTATSQGGGRRTRRR